MDESKRHALNTMMDRIDAMHSSGVSGLPLVKAMVAETLKLPGVTEKDRIEILTEMENGGYEALMHMLQNRKLPAGFDPTNRPWNRN